MTRAIEQETLTVFESAPGGAFVEKTHDFPQLGQYDVGVAIICCSVCYTDTMIASQENGVVVGHEIVGRIHQKGPGVSSHLQIGDMVGLGYIRSTCLECSSCLQGQENVCRSRMAYTNRMDGTLGGGLANAVVWDSRFVTLIPDSIEPRHAAPLTCAGATVFAALYGYNVSPTSTIGVVGLGGLGHMAIKFAKAWGCKVVAISSSPDKEHDARSFGAHEFICTTDPKALRSTLTRMDYILNTVSGDIPWDEYIALLNCNGTLINMGLAAGGSMSIPYIPALFNQTVVQKMYAFAALHGIRPEIEEVEMSVRGCAEAFRRVTDQQARYRVVLNVPQRLAL
ncbi:hypothetical protein BGW38_010856 [Lunasporangiospora selenospora]|uniref:Enoyl reductase (ER) domain-containing protein n=1 Tax=Lunasporangiospora selenospora TaxID=979761 RepID=A0A9P6KF95_9FUNG|nr:hypothetical protein BGW38_010856 [Lunasporangiospora selenospora]